ncbi:UNKNOWN [Stylonychia lemnae]|uniref:Uncharacterized protein n=1 Tax=Stylonychia lemnae TaxID=5949 RepID=A0A077ZTI8_STYLE|nr:UNKNOWN [Stylonychia lemnae]|eukprot:CDW71776.1 UNKNOWN [Stylonychia lemnae]
MDDNQINRIPRNQRQNTDQKLISEDSRYYDESNYNSQQLNKMIPSSQPNSGSKLQNLIGPAEKLQSTKLQSSFKNLHNTQNISKTKTNIKIIPKKNQIAASRDISPFKSVQVNTQNQTQNFQNNLILIKNQQPSPYQKQMVLNQQVPPSTMPNFQIKHRIQSAARAQTAQMFGGGLSANGSKSRRSQLPSGLLMTNQSKKRFTEGLTSINSKSQLGNYRETQNRAMRFNLDQDEQVIYQSFANILASFDESTRLELIESVLKDAQEIESQNEAM